MGLYTRRHDSSPGPFPPPPPTISVPSPQLNHHLRHDSSPFPFPSISPHSHDHDNHRTIRHNRRESLPGPSFPPTSPPPTLHSRRDSYPGPFPNLPSPPSSSSEPPPPLFHARRESCPGPFLSQRNESDSSLLPSTSSSSFLNLPHHQLVFSRLKRRLDLDPAWPFGELHGVDDDDIRETAYEIFFTACRSCPGFGGRSALTFHSKHENDHGGAPVSQTMSRVKRTLGLKMLRSSLYQRMLSSGRGGWSSVPLSPVADSSPRSRVVVPRRTMTMAEVMRLQMGVSEQSDSRLRKTLMRTLVGQVSQKQAHIN